MRIGGPQASRPTCSPAEKGAPRSYGAAPAALLHTDGATGRRSGCAARVSARLDNAEALGAARSSAHTVPTSSTARTVLALLPQRTVPWWMHTAATQRKKKGGQLPSVGPPRKPRAGPQFGCPGLRTGQWEGGGARHIHVESGYWTRIPRCGRATPRGATGARMRAGPSPNSSSTSPPRLAKMVPRTPSHLPVCGRRLPGRHGTPKERGEKVFDAYRGSNW